jgi:hypothetical protein
MKKLLSISILILLSNFVVAQVSKTINVSTAGTLTTLLTTQEKSTVTNLTVTGNIDARDVKCIAFEFSNLSTIDIKNVSIQAYSGIDGPFYLMDIIYPANEFPELSFYVKYIKRPTIKSIQLPLTLTSIGIGSVEYTGITSILIPGNVTSIKNTAFQYCADLKTVISLNTTPPTLENASVFQGSPISTVYVPIGCVPVYKSAAIWSNFTNILEYVLSVSSKPVSTITLSTAVLNANVDLITNSPVSSHGFCWNTSGSPTIADNKVDNGAKTTLGAFSNLISGLSSGTKYYVKAYATDGERTVYGNEVSFTTASLPDAAGLISGLQTVCQGQNSVTYTVPVVANATSYIWTLPNGVTGSSSTNSITVNYATTFTSGSISVKGHNSFGDGANSTLAITANLLPANAGTISGNTSICPGTNSVTYTVPVIANTTSYTWTLPMGGTLTIPTNYITINYPTTASSGILSVKGHNDCGDGVASTLAITVNQLPVVELRDTAAICGGTVPLFPVINYTGNGKLRYKWTPSTGLNNDTIAYPLATISGKITYTLTVSTSTGCTVSSSLTVKTLPMEKPTIGIVGVSSNKNRVVWNKPVTTGIESYYIYRETTVSNVFEKIGTVSYDSLSVFVDTQSAPDVKSSKYKLSIFDRNGVESPLSNAHKTMHLSINKGQNNTWNLIWEPYEGFTVSTYNIYRGVSLNSLNFLDATSGSSTQYSDVSAPNGDVYYQMEVISTTLVSPSKAPASMQKTKESENTTSSILASYSSSRSNIATNVLNGIKELDGESNNINIYPNPVKTEFRIDFEGGSIFEILNLTGQVVHTGNLKNSAVVQITDLSAGIYLIRFRIGNTSEYKKIIKQ